MINCQRRYCLDYGGVTSCINIQDTHIFLFYKSDTSWYFNLTVIRISGNYILRTSVLVVIERFCTLSGVGGAYHLILILRELLYRNSLITSKTLNKWNNSKTSWIVQYIIWRCEENKCFLSLLSTNYQYHYINSLVKCLSFRCKILLFFSMQRN